MALALTACTGRGGGQLPPVGLAFTGPATFGFDFSCEDNSPLAGPRGQLRIQLSYTDHGRNPIGTPFSIHGIVDRIDPVLESQLCIGQNPPYPDPKVLTFFGRYRLTSGAPADFPSTCPARETETTPLCRFEVEVRDNDSDGAPSAGDYFSIKLTTVTTPCTSYPPAPTCSVLPAGFYARAGLLSSGNIRVE
ncbi:MAG: hypothetical protein M3310_04720 [Actinomycetota bacterium]|nr:hypothetical protein [Actinomycetota bacterium]